MKREYTGTIVEQSLADKQIINTLEIVDKQVGNWTLYTVKVSEEEIESLSRNIKSNKWYMHFWKGKEVIAVFKDRSFKFNYDDKKSWEPAVKYGLAVGIPKKQLDFIITD